MPQRVYRSPVKSVQIIGNEMIICTKQGEVVMFVIDADMQKIFSDALDYNGLINDGKTEGE